MAELDPEDAPAVHPVVISFGGDPGDGAPLAYGAVCTLRDAVTGEHLIGVTRFVITADAMAQDVAVEITEFLAESGKPLREWNQHEKVNPLDATWTWRTLLATKLFVEDTRD